MPRHAPGYPATDRQTARHGTLVIMYIGTARTEVLFQPLPMLCECTAVMLVYCCTLSSVFNVSHGGIELG